jgi:hypothetical protein
MIDPKLNDIPAPSSTTGARPKSGSEQAGAGSAKGLSINDTIAGDTLLSTGSGGVDTSGVRAGAGAGAGTASLNTSPSGSPAPNVVGGSRGTGATPGSATSTGQSPVGRAETGVPGTGRTELDLAGDDNADYGDVSLSSDEISSRAFDYWCERGCPEGSPEVDWQRAEAEIRARRRSRTSAANA